MSAVRRPWTVSSVDLGDEGLVDGSLSSGGAELG